MNGLLSSFIRSGIGTALLFTGLSSTTALAQTSPSAHTFATRYDQLGRVTGTMAPDPDGTGALKFAAARTIFDARSLPIRVETGQLANWQSEAVAPSAWADFTILSSAESTYDVNRRKIKDVAKGSNGAIISLMQYSYDSFGRLDCTAVRMNAAVFGSPPASACTLGAEGTEGPDRVTKNVYDAAGQLLKVQKAVGTTLVQDYAVYTYTLNGKQQTVKDANANLAQYSYDGYDRQTRWTFPSKTSVGNIDATDYEEYGYDANSNRTSLRKRDGSVITYQYDALNRNTVKIVPERAGLAVTHTRDVHYGYDLRGLQTSARFDSASGEGLTTAYDGFGRMSLSTFTMDGIARTLSYSVDKGNNRTQLTFPDGNYFAFGYDGLDRMTVIGRNAASGLTRYVYNNRGSRDSLASGSYTYYAYDAAGRLTSINQDITSTANDVTYGLNQYNPASQVTQRSTSNDAYVWTGAVNVSRNYAVNGLNQYTSAGPATFTYDANGNLTGDGTNAYGYDVENRLIQASGATNATLRYDPLGRLYETSAGTVASTTRFLHDGVELVAEYNSSGVMLRRYVHGSGVDDPMAVFEGAGVADSAARLVKTNHQGSIVALTDWNGNLTAKNSYDDWGIPGSSNTSIAAGGRFSYTGQVWIPELGMYYYKARFYSATLGRFMQTDPIGYEDGMNIYAYVGNDPVNSIDTSGKKCTSYDGPTTCITSAYEVSFATPDGWTDFYDHDRKYHFQNVTSQSYLNVDQTRDWTKRNPTPGQTRDATKAGTLNDATPGLGGNSIANISPVLSYWIKNQKNGESVVVNVTQKGHPLEWGIVVISATDNGDGTSTINHYGEGNSTEQMKGSPVAGAINSVWKLHRPPPPPPICDLNRCN